MELWKDIQGFEGLYQISDNGQVKSLGKGLSTDSRTKQVRILKQRVKTNGYSQVKLSKDGRAYHKIVHRLVAIAFVDNPNGLPEVNHKDGNKLNNKAGNLEWVTSSQNQKHAFKTGLQKIRRGSESSCSKPIIQKSLDGKVIKMWPSIKEVKREAGFNTFGIIKCCKREKRYNTAYGYKWEYA